MTTVARGVIVYRWASLAWMAAVVLTYPDGFSRPWLAWTGLALAASWTAWLTASRAHGAATLVADLALAAGLLVASGLVAGRGELGGGRPYYATAWPLSAALAAGLELGPAAGLAAGGALGLAVLAGRPLNGVDLSAVSRGELEGTINGAVAYLLAGWASGVVSNLVRRAEDAERRATSELVRERERAARSAERERLARQIHDSVLQSLALVHKRLSEGPESVSDLAVLAGEQEATLRRLILREPEAPPEGRASLRDALEDLAGTGVTVSAVGPVFMERHAVEEVAAAVREALANVVRHARATRATVFADEDAGRVVVSVRDDGVGFVYDPQSLRAAGKAGLLGSISGRIQDLGGTVRVETSPGRGTDIEMAIPAP